MFTIKLNKLQFHAFHGLYEEEKNVGNTFEVNVLIHYTPPHERIDSIHDTIDYTKAYELVKINMQTPKLLLETLAVNIAQQILNTFTIAQKVEVSIQKNNPPIVGFQGNVEVTFTTSK